MFNLFKKQEPVPKPVEETITPKPTGEYYIDCTAMSNSSWHISLMKKNQPYRPVSIRSYSAGTDQERERLIADFKQNKDKYIKDYEYKLSKNVRIPL